MLDMVEINKEIKKLEEECCTDYSTCNKLAILYIVRDHYKGTTTKDTISEPMKMTAQPKGI